MQKVVYAKLNNCLMSSQKVRLVADLIRGKSAQKAKDILAYTNKAAAKDVLKVLNSAIANSVHNDNLDKNTLVVTMICVDEATTYKRGRATARGRYHQILKRNCNIKIGLSSTEQTKIVEEVKEEKKVSKTKAVKKVTKNLSKKVVKK